MKNITRLVIFFRIHKIHQAKNRRKQAKIYDRIEAFTSEVEMKEFVDSNNWGYDLSNKIKFGLKTYYHCKKCCAIEALSLRQQLLDLKYGGANS